MNNFILHPIRSNKFSNQTPIHINSIGVLSLTGSTNSEPLILFETIVV